MDSDDEFPSSAVQDAKAESSPDAPSSPV
jgi:hypothetical protein